MSRGFVTRSAVGALGLLVAGPALAVDGVIEINQARALAGGVTPGDLPGFPVQIFTPGSYRLTGDLTVPDTNTGAIEVQASRVSIDLNGFSITGPGTCSGCPVTSCTGGSGRGIYNLAAGEGVGIAHGAIKGMGAAGIDVIGGVAIEGVLVTGNGGKGMQVTGAGALVKRAAFIGNGDDGLASAFLTSVTESTADCNRNEGIEVGEASRLVGNTLNGNGGSGIVAGNGSTVTGNMASANTGRGISVGGGSSVTENASRQNGSYGIYGIDSTISGNSAQSNSAEGFYVVGGSTLTGNTAQANANAGILCGDGCTATGNTARSNGGVGLWLGAGSGYAGNVLTLNNGGNINPQVFGGTEIGTNLCATDTVCP